jgi:hypothetical protein
MNSRDLETKNISSDKSQIDGADAYDKTDSGDSVSADMLNSKEMTLWETVQSVLFAMLGVQNSKNAKRDFSKGKASHFIVIGVAFGILFVLSVALAVNLILSSI